MRDDDRAPTDDDGRHGDGEKEHEYLSGEQVVEEYGEKRHARGDEDTDDGHALTRQTRENFRRIAARSESV